MAYIHRGGRAAGTDGGGFAVVGWWESVNWVHRKWNRHLRRLRLRRYAPGALTYQRLTQQLRRWGQDQRVRRDLLTEYSRPRRLDLRIHLPYRSGRPSPMYRRLRHLLLSQSPPTSLSATRVVATTARAATQATARTRATTTRTKPPDDP